MGSRIDEVFGEGLSALEGTERNIEEVGQAEVLSVSSVAMVGCLEGWKMWKMSLAGMSWRAVAAPSVSLFSLRLEDSSSSPSQSSLLITLMQLQLLARTLLHTP